MQTTIAAVSTPSGTGGIGIVRLSGESALKVAQAVFRPYGGRALSGQPGYTGVLGRIVGPDGELDEAIAFCYRAPKSYTGEDVVELSCHGGRWVVQAVLRLCLQNGAELAGPGEFTRRAFLNGKLSLDQAEAVMNLIGAQSDAALKAALEARDGALSRETGELVRGLVALSGHLAAWADFPEEDVPEVDSRELSTEIGKAVEKIRALLSTYDRGRILREGIDTVILGKPNVGKSTLMNLLAGFERSIVTEHPGTTRDLVEDSVRLGDFVLRLKDTAGIRQSGDPVESLGINRALGQIETAQLILAVFDCSRQLDAEDLHLLRLLRDKPAIAVVNKIDLPSRLSLQAIREQIPNLVEISAATGEGREELQKTVERFFCLNTPHEGGAAVASERQRDCLVRSLTALSHAIQAVGSGVTLDAVTVCLDDALDALLSLSGEKVSELVLEEVFSRFCVGK